MNFFVPNLIKALEGRQSLVNRYSANHLHQSNPLKVSMLAHGDWRAVTGIQDE
jgi:hypothetical protein